MGIQSLPGSHINITMVQKTMNFWCLLETHLQISDLKGCVSYQLTKRNETCWKNLPALPFSMLQSRGCWHRCPSKTHLPNSLSDKLEMTRRMVSVCRSPVLPMEVMKVISNKTYFPFFFFFHIEIGKNTFPLERSDVDTVSPGKTLLSPVQKGD